MQITIILSFLINFWGLLARMKLFKALITTGILDEPV